MSIFSRSTLYGYVFGFPPDRPTLCQDRQSNIRYGHAPLLGRSGNARRPFPRLAPIRRTKSRIRLNIETETVSKSNISFHSQHVSFVYAPHISFLDNIPIMISCNTQPMAHLTIHPGKKIAAKFVCGIVECVDYSSDMTRLRRTPMFSISDSITSPAFR